MEQWEVKVAWRSIVPLTQFFSLTLPNVNDCVIIILLQIFLQYQTKKQTCRNHSLFSFFFQYLDIQVNVFINNRENLIWTIALFVAQCMQED